VHTAAPELIVTDFPAGSPPRETGFRALLHHTRLLFGRQTLVWSRDKKILIQSIIYPALSMIMFKVVLGDAITMVTGVNSAYGTVPLVVLVGAMFGSLAAGVKLRRERRTGLLGRIYVMPVHKAADLSARIGSELVRILISTIVLTTIGMLIGWRFDQGPLAALGIFVIPLLFGAAFSTIMLAVAVNATNLPLVPLMSLFSSLLLFFNSGFSPVIGYPDWLQPIVRYQPMTCAIDAMRGLALGKPVGEELVLVVLWTFGLIAVFAYPAISGFRRAAATRA
jgi:ABC-2 type transport system permease protein